MALPKLIYRNVNYFTDETLDISTDLYSAALGCVFQEDEDLRIRCFNKETGDLVYYYEDGAFILEDASRDVDIAFTDAMQYIKKLEVEKGVLSDKVDYMRRTIFNNLHKIYSEAWKEWQALLMDNDSMTREHDFEWFLTEVKKVNIYGKID